MESDVLQNFIKSKKNGSDYYREKLLTMLGSSRYKFAYTMLSSIYSHIEETGQISDKQRAAIDNIYDGATKASAKRGAKKHAACL